MEHNVLLLWSVVLATRALSNDHVPEMHDDGSEPIAGSVRPVLNKI